jgi:hypothetical protein
MLFSLRSSLRHEKTVAMVFIISKSYQDVMKRQVFDGGMVSNDFFVKEIGGKILDRPEKHFLGRGCSAWPSLESHKFWQKFVLLDHPQKLFQTMHVLMANHEYSIHYNNLHFRQRRISIKLCHSNFFRRASLTPIFFSFPPHARRK